MKYSKAFTFSVILGVTLFGCSGTEQGQRGGPVVDPCFSACCGAGCPDGNSNSNATPNPTPTPQANLDLDGDGLTNDEEGRLGTNPDKPDTDDDGLRDGEEVLSYRTEPLNKDSDADYIGDAAEVARGGGIAATTSNLVLAFDSTRQPEQQVVAVNSPATFFDIIDNGTRNILKIDDVGRGGRVLQRREGANNIRDLCARSPLPAFFVNQPQKFTVVAMVKADRYLGSDKNIVFSLGEAFSLNIDLVGGDGNYRPVVEIIGGGNSSFTTGARNRGQPLGMAVEPGLWYQVAAMVDLSGPESRVHTYLNALPVFTDETNPRYIGATLLSTGLRSMRLFSMGRGGDDCAGPNAIGSNFFGSIDEVFIFDDFLSTADLQALRDSDTARIR